MSPMLARAQGEGLSPSGSERAELALALIESLDGPADAGVEEAWQIEIERRVAEVERREVQLIPGAEVFERLRRRLG